MDTVVRTKRILILDDEPGILELLDSYLQSCGFETHPTSRWTQAVELITHHPPDLVLLDLQMPTIQGDSVLAFIREQVPSLPVIIVSAYLNDEKIEALRRIGARGFVSKPFQLSALAAAIREALELPAEAPAPSPPPPKATPAAQAEVPLPAPADSGDASSGDTVYAPQGSEAAEPPIPHTRPGPHPQGRHRHPHPQRRRRPRNLKLYVVISLVCLIGALVVLLIEKLPTYVSGTLEQAVEKSIQSESKRQRKSIEGLSDKEKEALRKVMEKR